MVVVIDVEIRELLPALVSPSYEAFERPLLGLPVMRPPVAEQKLAILPKTSPEEIFTPLTDQREASMSKKTSLARGVGQESQTQRSFRVWR